MLITPSLYAGAEAQVGLLEVGTSVSILQGGVLPQHPSNSIKSNSKYWPEPPFPTGA